MGLATVPGPLFVSAAGIVNGPGLLPDRAFTKSTALTFCVDYALVNYRPPEHEKPLDKDVEEYVAFKRREHERGIISAIQVKSIKKEQVLLVS